jgi:hypothetical protein
MALLMKAVLKISCIPNAALRNLKQNVIQMHYCHKSVFRTSWKAFNMNNNTLWLTSNADGYSLMLTRFTWKIIMLSTQWHKPTLLAVYGTRVSLEIYGHAVIHKHGND